jgi:hypothetical protein
VLLDCGFGSFASYLDHAQASRLDAIVVSHAHGDHSADLDDFLSFAPAWRERPRVIVSYETLSAMTRQPSASDVEVIVVSDGSLVERSTFRVECSSTTHQLATLAVQVTMGGARVVYGADTGPGWRIPSPFLRPDVGRVVVERQDRGGGACWGCPAGPPPTPLRLRITSTPTKLVPSLSRWTRYGPLSLTCHLTEMLSPEWI